MPYVLTTSWIDCLHIPGLHITWQQQHIVTRLGKEEQREAIQLVHWRLQDRRKVLQGIPTRKAYVPHLRASLMGFSAYGEQTLKPPNHSSTARHSL